MIVFIESKSVLLKEILENSDFASQNYIVATNKKKAYIIILLFYKLNTQICQEE